MVSSHLICNSTDFKGRWDLDEGAYQLMFAPECLAYISQAKWSENEAFDFRVMVKGVISKHRLASSKFSKGLYMLFQLSHRRYCKFARWFCLITSYLFHDICCGPIHRRAIVYGDPCHYRLSALEAWHIAGFASCFGMEQRILCPILDVQFSLDFYNLEK
ncbi:hypothetical protein KI387_009919, partial [Taxus chinensis]